MDRMTVSIITPSYHQGQFIERTIQSVLSQNIADLEYIIIDGGSIDETVSILRKYQNQLRWVSEQDEGQGEAVNKGIKLSSGEIIGWLNSDDIYYPDAISKVCQFFADHPDVDVVYGAANEIDVNDQVTGKYLTETWNLARLKIHCFISQPAAFFRRSAVEKYGMLDMSLQFCMDYEYWMRLGLKGAKFAYMPEVLAGTRLYAETKSSRFYVQAHFEAVSMLQHKLGYIPSDWIVNYSSAKIKTETGLSFPHPHYIYKVSSTIWTISGLYNKGYARVLIWLKAQLSIAKKLAFRLLPVRS
jgi:glycosyltransferase involved in cell wall biosynthesis